MLTIVTISTQKHGRLTDLEMRVSIYALRTNIVNDVEYPPPPTTALAGPPPGQVVHQLIKLHREGHRIVILGHSLGGGVAALLGVLLKDVRMAEQLAELAHVSFLSDGTTRHAGVRWRVAPLLCSRSIVSRGLFTIMRFAFLFASYLKPQVASITCSTCMNQKAAEEYHPLLPGVTFACRSRPQGFGSGSLRRIRLKKNLALR